MPIKTRPDILGAPLSPTDYTGGLLDEAPDVVDVQVELARAQIELMHAIAKHRKAWKAMAMAKAAAEERAVWADAYTPYKIAVGDVRWWREEMTAQATTVTALKAMLAPKNRST